jgi:hypothetical protein
VRRASGFGLSYTNWSYSVVQQPANLSLQPVRTLLAKTAAAGHLFPQLADQLAVENASQWRSRARFCVNVTNMGDRDADDVVLGFVEPPLAGVGGRPRQILYDFTRVHVLAHSTITVALTPATTDLALAQLNGTFRAAPGTYQARFGVQEAERLGMGFAAVQFLAI